MLYAIANMSIRNVFCTEFSRSDSVSLMIILVITKHPAAIQINLWTMANLYLRFLRFLCRLTSSPMSGHRYTKRFQQERPEPLTVSPSDDQRCLPPVHILEGRRYWSIDRHLRSMIDRSIDWMKMQYLRLKWKSHFQMIRGRAVATIASLSRNW